MRIQKADIEKGSNKHNLTKGVAMKMARAMVLTAAVMACGAWVSFAGTGQKTADSTKAFVCDTAKCRLQGSHADNKTSCPIHKAMKCNMDSSPKCKYMHAKADSTKPRPGNSGK
jgi:hypothetical protein